MLDKLAALVSTLLALSLAVERVIEILKGMLAKYWLFREDTESSKEQKRCALIHILSALIGCVIAGLGHIAIIGSWNFEHYLDNTGNVLLVGLLSSWGSAFWNHILDILKAMKVDKEVKAKLALVEHKAVTGDRTAYIA